MAYENLCMYCFKDPGGKSICPHCGKDARTAVSQIQLLPGTTVYRDRFLVGRALGQDANGIVYTALDTKRGGTIRIREYLPRSCAERLNDGSVVPLAGLETNFEAGMKKLRASVESVDDPGKRHFFFEENGTAYIVQRKNSASSAAAYADDDDDYESGSHRSVVLYIVIAAAVVLAVALGIIWFLNSMEDPDDVTLTNPISTVDSTWKPAETPTPTPYVTATFAALVDPELSWMDYTYAGNVDYDYNQQVNQRPTATPRPRPSVDTQPNYATVGKDSDRQTILQLQNYLAQLGWLEVTGLTGTYDSATVAAVKDFQRYVNEYCNPAKKLTVDGIAGKNTLQWLVNSSVSLVKPTPTPTPLVTAAPDENLVDAYASAKEIRAVQNKLIALGLMPGGSADGVYGSATSNAVINFQVRVNQLLGYEVLEITGIVDELSMAYLDYYVEWWAQQQLATATPSPTQLVTIAPENTAINADSPRSEITRLQEMLEAVGLIAPSQIDGVYGRNTYAAVERFQNWVNEKRNEYTLDLTGEADLLTQEYLKYCIENDMRVEVSVPTEAPATYEPTEVPPQEDVDENTVVVNASSAKESIMYVQQMLNGIGLLDADGVDGDYGRGTSAAVITFQQFVNAEKGQNLIKITGECDSLTLQYLEYYYDNEWDVAGMIEATDKTPVPTEAPATEAPATYEPTQVPPQEDVDENTVVVNASSAKESILYVQQMLNGIGLLNADGVDGDYGRGTVSAVKAFQQFVNTEKGQNLINVSGECDSLTLQYLEYCYDNEWDVAGMIEATDKTPVPTEAPQPEADRLINADSPAAEVEFVQKMLSHIGMIDESNIDGDYDSGTENAVKTFQQFVNWKEKDGILEVTGECDAKTLEYLTYCYANNWDVAGEIAQAQSTPAPTEAPADPDTQDDVIRDGSDPAHISAVQQMLNHIGMISADNIDGDYDSATENAVKTFQQFVNWKEKGDILEVTGECDKLTLKYLEYCYDKDWDVAGMIADANATPAPDPTEAPEPDPTDVPMAEISAFEVFIDGREAGDKTVLEPGSYEISWAADGSVECYYLYLYDDDGDLIRSAEETDLTGFIMETSSMKAQRVYRLKVGAMPAGGTKDNIIWRTLELMRSADSTPEPTAAPTKKPTAGKPVININSAVYQKDGVTYINDTSIIFSWMAEGQVKDYTVYLEYQSGETFVLGTVNDTSKTVTRDQLTPGLWKLHVGATPVGGDEDDTVWNEKLFGVPEPAATEAPIEATQPPVDEQPVMQLDKNSLPRDIERMQLLLYRLGFYAKDAVPAIGELDDYTIDAFISFQLKVNEVYGANITLIDPAAEEILIDQITLAYLQDPELDLLSDS